MEFDSEEEAYNFYNEYAKVIGFGIRKHSMHKDASGRFIDRIFCCACQGRRAKDKRDPANCGAVWVGSIGWGGPTVLLNTPKADDISSSGIAPKAGYYLMSKQVGGRENVGFIFEDYKNYLRSKRTMEMKIGDTGGVLEYLQQKQLVNPNFFYAIQVDEDDLIDNIIWVDAQMMVDYSHFGGVVSFDTTYRKNREGRPFALFVGVNHHKQTIVFGAALLYDETASTFIWLFDTFAKAMYGKQPKTILTDQDAAIAKALAITWPNTYHRLCIWHIYQYAAIHLSSVFARFTSFSKDFSSCIYDFEEEEEFLCAWEEMLDKYELKTNEWLERMFKLREKWALVYGRQHFCADMITTQRSEKLKADLRTCHSTPVACFPVEILKHAASVYTHEVFELFQNELRKAYDSQIELCGEIEETFEYKITPFRKHYQHTIMYDFSQEVEVKLENMIAISPYVGRKSVVKKALVSRVDEKQSIAVSLVLENAFDDGGSGSTQKTCLLKFLVVDTPSAYNVILRRHTLNGFQAVISTYHMKIKFSTAGGVGEVQGDSLQSCKCYVEAVRKVKRGTKDADELLGG
ncbi:protein FAR1-RELATED SEQUENCE 5 [Sesamum angolense]|uniref:Protein FAR1-RELATED SEQUENCE 5 n=1 Tax=Sesamum angolense TaxID=2727404 RepID=A0AAE1WPN7_9LAMI|nr:protein FAR1-RELATED SEQUENCE 5 [Sesamum angolense]